MPCTSFCVSMRSRSLSSSESEKASMELVDRMRRSRGLTKSCEMGEPRCDELDDPIEPSLRRCCLDRGGVDGGDTPGAERGETRASGRCSPRTSLQSTGSVSTASPNDDRRAADTPASSAGPALSAMAAWARGPRRSDSQSDRRDAKTISQKGQTARWGEGGFGWKKRRAKGEGDGDPGGYPVLVVYIQTSDLYARSAIKTFRWEGSNGRRAVPRKTYANTQISRATRDVNGALSPPDPAPAALKI
mmetsp:Transcript_24195/g.72215  ORF Transcript_24195/g.72215 Transcript_24195/m.72215 type:complete len:246 (-) Transcript_24195:9-746(-)